MKNKRIYVMANDDGVTMYQMWAGLEIYTSRVGYLPEYIVMTPRAVESYQNILVERMDKPDFCGIPIITTTELTKLLTKKYINEKKNGK
jgi:hypothetical protein